MQFLIKWEVDVEIGGTRAPIACDARFGMALDDQPTACLLGRSEPVHYIESDIARIGNTLDCKRRKLPLL